MSEEEAVIFGMSLPGGYISSQGNQAWKKRDPKERNAKKREIRNVEIENERQMMLH